MTPPILRLRLLHTRSVSGPPAPPEARPEGGWLRMTATPASVELAAMPAPAYALAVALDAALACNEAQPGPRLLDWLTGLPDGPLRWDGPARDRFFTLLAGGGPRAWRFLSVTGVLDRALPELAEAINRRQIDPHELDPIGALRWPRLDRAQELRSEERRVGKECRL